MKYLSASEFKANYSSLLDNLPKEGVVITKRGKPVAKVIPVVHKNGAHLIGALKGEFEILGDIMSTGIEWEADSDS